MDPEAQKHAARKAAFARRKQAFAAQAPGAAARLSEVLSAHRGQPLAGYMPIRTEIDPLPAMTEAARSGPVGVPVIAGAGRPLRFALWSPEARLLDGPFGARIPDPEIAMTPRILIVPLVAFTRDGARLGYGGGFYDRTLEALRREAPVLAIGFAFSAQQAPHLPQESTDQPLDLIVTETDILEPGQPAR